MASKKSSPKSKSAGRKRQLSDTNATRSRALKAAEQVGVSKAAASSSLWKNAEAMLSGPPSEFVSLPTDELKNLLQELQAHQIELEQRVEERTRALKQEHQFVQQLIETAQAAILVLDPQGRIALANPYMVEHLGYASDELIGRDWFATFIPDGERTQIKQIFKHALDGHRTRGNVNKILCKDGQELDFEWYDNILTDARGGTTGLLCVGMDVTEREGNAAAMKESERLLRRLTQRLMNAQEEESRHIARELHDAFSQKLAALSMDATQLEAEAGSISETLGEKLKLIRAEINEMASAIHAMSRRLHPAILTDLGLAATLKVECRAFAERTSIPTKFEAELMHENIPDSVALCLYRVLQETLNNIGRHSGAGGVDVNLVGDEDEVTLRVEDLGNGFELASARGKGLGLISMEERTNLEGGKLRIDSEPSVGTTVEARIPLQPVEP